MKEMIHHAPIGIFQSTLDGNLLYVNPAVARILGYATAEECLSSIGNLGRDLHVDPDRRTTLVEQVLKHGELRNFESSLKRKDHTIIIGKLNVRLARDSGGEASHLEAYLEDITQQKLVEEALKQSEEQYRSVFENTGACTIIIEKDKTISLVNGGFEKLSGYARKEIEGKIKWPHFIAKKNELEMMQEYHLRRREMASTVPIEYEFTLRDRHGAEKDVFLRVDVIPGTEQSIASMVDTSSLKIAERSYRESHSKLLGVMEAFNGYIYSVSKNHDIIYMNTNLAGIAASQNGETKCYQRIYRRQEKCPWCPLTQVFEGETVKEEFRNPLDSRYYYSVSSPIYHTGDRVDSCQTVLLDINERKVEELAVKEREEYLHKENLRLRSTMEERYRFGDIVGKSEAMQRVYKMILRAAATDANVIIYGETGTGKELVARAIHGLSDRSKNSFVPLNCGAISPGLMESELFGYKKGAFTGATENKAGLFDHADKGTLFLDELGEINESTQVKLLRVLEGNGYIPVGGVETAYSDARIIAATNRNLQQFVESGRLREDFFYRVHIIPIHLPPLRERKGDIPLLIEHFLRKYEGEKNIPQLRGWEIEALLAHHWPGNIRELENTLERYVNLHHLDILQQPAQSVTEKKSLVQQGQASWSMSLRTAVADFEKHFISESLHKYGWNRTRVAEALGIERKTLYLKMQRLGIQPNKN